MPSIGETTGSGIFYVQSQTKPEQSDEEFHDWYNNEHGPLRVKLDFIENGYRFEDTTTEPTLHLATYDMDHVSGLEEPQYTRLRGERSNREIRLVSTGLSRLDRRMYSLFSSKGECKKPPPVVLSVRMFIKAENIDKVDAWYEDEHVDMLSKIPGWLRSRRYRIVWAENMQEGEIEIMALHDFEAKNGLEGPEHQKAKSTPWRDEVFQYIPRMDRKLFKFTHEFHADDWRQPPHEKAMSDSDPHVTTKDGVDLEYRFDGSQDANAPVIAFSNSLLTNYHIWDGVVAHLFMKYPHFRFLRYNTRGYSTAIPGETRLSTLTNDVAYLLDQLKITKIHALVGVSLGGATALDFAIKYPDRLSKFVACDCPISSGGAFNKAWDERIKLANSGPDGYAELATQTVKRWTTDDIFEKRPDLANPTKEMVVSSSKDGFESLVGALCNLDLTEGIKGIKVKGLCVVGERDGALPKVIEDFSKTIPEAKFVKIKDAGHLPMLENLEGFMEGITDFLA